MWNESIIIELLATHFVRAQPHKASIFNRFLTKSGDNAEYLQRSWAQKTDSLVQTYTQYGISRGSKKYNIPTFCWVKCPANMMIFFFFISFFASFALVRLLKRQNESITDNTVVVKAYWEISTRERTPASNCFSLYIFSLFRRFFFVIFNFFQAGTDAIYFIQAEAINIKRMRFDATFFQFAPRSCVVSISLCRGREPLW